MILVLVVLFLVRSIDWDQVLCVEYYVLFLLVSMGMMFAVSVLDFLVVYLGLEFMSICFYILVGIRVEKLMLNEVVTKYFLLSFFVLVLFLYGISLIYGVVGIIDFVSIVGVFSG